MKNIIILQIKDVFMESKSIDKLTLENILQKTYY